MPIGTCVSCADGYYLKSGKCIKCPENCKKCDSEGKCLECAIGYNGLPNCAKQCNWILDESKQCVCPKSSFKFQDTCVPCDMGCLECDLKCNKCMEGYWLNG